ncbi:hypothetical protein R5R35_007709 [Gryllus longicercus]|uniref:MD-2-related lipid-recognition domain-containing protein n=1 Tax=Gryllus longicercus TaxID=2509291 RepID=A0AAN9V4H9_9ORTH
MIRAIVFLAFVAIATATPFKSCKNGLAPVYVDIPGCDSLPCKFIRGRDIAADVDFLIDHTVSTLNTKVMATSLGVTIEYPLPDPNACNGLTNSECPLKDGEEVIYHLEMPILSIYPKVRVDLEFSFLDQNKQVVACFEVSGTVVDS